MNATLVLIHGRAQEFKDPGRLASSWRAALASGLISADLPQLDCRVVLPYYGNELYRITAELARRGEPIELEALSPDIAEPGPFHASLPSDIGMIERSLVGDMANAVGAPEPEGFVDRLQDVLSWRAARDALSWVSRHTRVDKEIIKAHLKDVAIYLTVARDRVLDLVRADIPPDGSVVVVSHSLGTVVARDLLDDTDLRDRTVLWVTAGSPLGLRTVQRNLRTPGVRHPGVEWITVYDVNDIVALSHPLLPEWGMPLRDIEVENGNEPHAIGRYLAHCEVAMEIDRAVRAS